MTMVAPLPVGRVDLKKAEEAQKAAQAPKITIARRDEGS